MRSLRYALWLGTVIALGTLQNTASAQVTLNLALPGQQPVFYSNQAIPLKVTVNAGAQNANNQFFGSVLIYGPGGSQTTLIQGTYDANGNCTKYNSATAPTFTAGGTGGAQAQVPINSTPYNSNIVYGAAVPPPGP